MHGIVGRYATIDASRRDLPPSKLLLLLLVLVLVLTDVTFAKKLFHEAIVADGKVYVDCVVPEPW